MASKVDDRRNAGKILHQNARRHIGDFARRVRLWVPLGEEFDVIGSYAFAVFLSQQVLKQNTQAVRQARELDPFLFKYVEAENFVGAVSSLQLRLAAKTISRLAH